MRASEKNNRDKAPVRSETQRDKKTDAKFKAAMEDIFTRYEKAFRDLAKEE